MNFQEVLLKMLILIPKSDINSKKQLECNKKYNNNHNSNLSKDNQSKNHLNKFKKVLKHIPNKNPFNNNKNNNSRKVDYHNKSRNNLHNNSLKNQYSNNKRNKIKIRYMVNLCRKKLKKISCKISQILYTVMTRPPNNMTFNHQRPPTYQEKQQPTHKNQLSEIIFYTNVII